MCGIVGALGDLLPEKLEAMVKKMAHRGPDYSSHLSLGNVHLGHARLSIIDLSSNSNQPLWDVSQKVCIVFNGEIYNYKCLRQELISFGYAFSSQGDAEVILNLYLHYGPTCLDKLQGIFAFALWDNHRQELLVARDPFGVKPLYYTENQDGFYFASELKSLLLLPSLSPELNYDALFRTIVFLWSPGPETVMKNILKLEPGSYLIVKNNKIINKIQYNVWPVYTPEKMTKAQACDQLQEALSASVRDQLVSDVPVGAFLSGGLDSSLIVAMAKQAGVENLACFTIKSMENDEKHEGFVDDLPYAKIAAKYLNVDLNIVDAAPNVLQSLLKMIYHLDEPQADPATFNVSLICEMARNQGIKVLFSGAGGDDIFTGYRRHLAVSFERYWTRLPMFIRLLLEKNCRQLPKKHPFLRRVSKLFAYATKSENERLLSYFYWIDPQVVLDLFTDEVKCQLSDNPLATMLRDLKQRSEKSKLEKMLYLERRYFLVDHNFNYTDKMSMAHGVEVRVPFLDSRVIEVASRLHSKFKQRRGEGKWILKQMAERYLPKSIIYRPKAGFGAPLRKWLQADLKPLVDELLSVASVKHRGLFKPELIQQLIAKDLCGKEDYSYSIFALLCIEIWCRIFIDNKGLATHDVI